MDSTITEMENTLEGINSKLGDTGECVNDLEDIIMEIAQSEQQQ